MKTFLSIKQLFTKTVLFLILLLGTLYVDAQRATVAVPIGIGFPCDKFQVGQDSVKYFDYNSITNTLTHRLNCQPTLAAPGFSAWLATISFNPYDGYLYFTQIALVGGVYNSYVYRWLPTTCPNLATLPVYQTFLGQFVAGVEFDPATGLAYQFNFVGPGPYTMELQEVNFTTGTLGPLKPINFGGNTIAVQAGDIIMTPGGQLLGVYDNKYFTVNWKDYNTATPLVATLINTLNFGVNNYLVGLSYADGKLVGSISPFGSGYCGASYQELDILTGAQSPITYSAGVPIFASNDMTTITSGIGAAKKLISASENPVGSGIYDVVYEVVIKNYGSTPITNVQAYDTLNNINGFANVISGSITSFTAPAGFTANTAYDGKNAGKFNLLTPGSTLSNIPGQNTITLRISCKISNILPGVVYYNQAVVEAVGIFGDALRDLSTNGSNPDLNLNDKPDDAGEAIRTPFLVSITPQTPPCALLTKVLYTQDFGTGTGLSTTIPPPVGGIGVMGLTGISTYTGSVVNPLPLETYAITNNSNNGNGLRWINLTDHTGGSNGQMLVANADADNRVIYGGQFNFPLCANQQYSLSFYAAFIGNASYQTVCDAFGGFVYPKIKMRIYDGVSGLVITEATTVNITATNWNHFGLKFKSPASYNSLRFELINEAAGGCGNDIAVDDIQFGSCDPLPNVILNNSNAGCLGSDVTFSALLSDPGALLGTPEYQWEISNDGMIWVPIIGATNPTYTINPMTPSDVNKYYHVKVASVGNINNPSCSYTSPSHLLVAGCDIDDDDDGIPDTVESGGVDPLNDDDMDGIRNYLDTNYPGFVDVNGDGINDNFDADLDGIINELDLDSDNDGIPDVIEAGGVDTNGDGKIDNYTDTDFDGFSQNVDANNTGSAVSGIGLGIPDTDGDGIPNYFDLDSDNDGIPDVVEVFGADVNNDGRIDGFIDANGNGFSDNVEGAVNGLLKSGADINNDGRADSWPNKNMDGDTKPNPYDLDSDGDGISDVMEAQLIDANWDGRVDGAVNFNGRNTVLAAMGSFTLPNTDGAGRANPFDIDSDDDGIPDNIEGLTTNGYLFPSYTDTDGDGIDNAYDNFVGFGGDGIHPVDKDADGTPDYLDLDTDNDGLADIVEGNDFNLNGLRDDLVTLTGIDTDGDGLDDRFDNNNSSIKGTSAYMGTAGSFTGDVAPGSRTMVQQTAVATGLGCAAERDWRCLFYVLHCDIITFKAISFNQNVTLDWSVLCRQPVDYFIIERSIDGNNFSEIQTVQGRSMINEAESYNGIDNITGVTSNMIYYRLKTVLKNGNVSLSNIIIIKNNGQTKQTLQVFPNPVKNQLQLNILADKTCIANVYIIDVSGRIVSRFNEKLQQGNNSISWNGASYLSTGSYYLKLDIGGEVLTTNFNIIN